MNVTVKNALISVYDKQGIEPLGQALTEQGATIYSTGGTLIALQNAGIPCRAISDLTKFPEILGGRVKTLNPAVFAGLLARRGVDDDLQTLADWGFPLFDLVVVNLYPFEAALKDAEENPKPPNKMIELIDIGGVALLRAAAKNFAYVMTCSDPGDYPSLIEELETNDGATSLKTRLAGAQKAFETTTHYDSSIGGYMTLLDPGDAEKAFNTPIGTDKDTDRKDTNKFLNFYRPIFKKVQDLRYGENSHQQAAFYEEWSLTDEGADSGLSAARQLQGKELSYNNIMDADTALEVIREFDEPCCVVLKHSNPCGLAVGANVEVAYERARATDPTSAFGGIIGVNRAVTAPLAEAICETFNEVVLAPEFEPAALEVLKKKKNLRLLAIGPLARKSPTLQPRAVVGGILLQDRDIAIWDDAALKVVTKTQPTEEDWRGLAFAWKCVKWVKSNAIVFTSATETIGIGAGQMSRVDSTKFAIEKALKPVEGSYLASDAFFPFADSIDAAAEAGVRAIIQPGGSIRDEEVIAAADKHGIIMVFTGMRHFRH